MRGFATHAPMLAALVGLAAVALLAGRDSTRPTPPVRDSRQPVGPPPTATDLIAGYRTWTRVNPRPARMLSWIARLCAPESPGQLAMLDTDLHHDRYATVYVNDIGRHAMLRQKRPRFPLGSIVVKEKLPSAASPAPEPLTVMRKREPGYNPGNGDWEYMVVDGSGTRVLEQGRRVRCQGCHASERATDFVSRDYLPVALRRRLR